MKEKEDNIMDNESKLLNESLQRSAEQQRAAAVASMTTSLLTGMCANPNFWIVEGKKLGVPDDQPSVVVLAAVALEQAETLIRILTAAQEARAANIAAGESSSANDE